MNYTSKAVRGAIFVFAFTFVAAICGYLFRVILSRNMSPSDFGLFFAILAFITFFISFSDFGASASVTKFIPEFQAKKKYNLIKGSILFVFFFQLILSTIISISLFFSSSWLAKNYFHTIQAEPILKIFSILFWFMSFSVAISSIQGFQRMGLYSTINLVRNALVLLLLVILFKFNKSIISVTYAYSFASVVAVIISVLFLFISFPNFFRVKYTINKQLIYKIFSYGLSLTLASLGYILLTYVDTALLTYFRTLDEVGYYSLVVSISSMVIVFFAAPLSTVILPLTSEMSSKKHILSIKNGITNLLSYSLFFSSPFLLVFLSFPDIIIRVLFGENYVVAAYALQILAIGMFFNIFAFINSNVIAGLGKPQVNTRLMIISGIFNLVVCYLLIPPFGYIGAAIGLSLSYLLLFILSSIKLRQLSDVMFPIKIIFKTTTLSLLLVILTYFLKSTLNLSYILELLIIGFIDAVLYVYLSLLWKVVDLEQIKSIVKSSLFRVR